MICAIHQPQFLPWLGHFQKIRMADVFVFLDSVQFQKNEFQNRNRIPTRDGVRWLTVPVTYTFGEPIRAVRIAAGRPWQRKLRGTLEHAYGKGPQFEKLIRGFDEILKRPWPNLAELNRASVLWLMERFEIRTETRIASDLPTCSNDRTGRLVDICRHLGATTYLSGAQAAHYLDIQQFSRAGITVKFQQYDHPVYPQMSSDAAFVSHMSAIDALLNLGAGNGAREKLNL